MLTKLRRLHDDQRGISAVVVAVSLIALFGAAVLSVDSGNVRSTRRSIITGTDASVLDAAQAFNTGMFNPCDALTSGSATWNAANQHATDVLHQNHPEGEHDLTDPLQFTVEVLDPGACTTGGYTPGKVYYEGRLEAEGFFSGVFGFGNTKPLSTSTAAWGYIQGIGDGLRPFSVCAGDRQFTDYLRYWNAIHNADPSDDASETALYDGYYGTDLGIPGDQDPSDGVTPNQMDDGAGNPAYGLYPAKSMGYPPGEADPPPDQKSNPNFGKTYRNPASSTTGSVFHPVVRVVTPDRTSSCGYSNGNRGWIDLRGAGDNGAASADDLRSWLFNGYPGEVSLTGPDCDPTEDGSPEYCGASPGDKNTLMEPLHELTCDVDTPALNCEYIFPILVVNCIGRIDSSGACVHDSSTGGENAEYVHEAFIFIVLRGYGKVANSAVPDGDQKGVLALDMEFVDVQASGEVGGTPPPGAPIYQTGTQLCGADHAENHCPF